MILINALGLSCKEDGVAIKCDADLVDLLIGWAGACDDASCGDIVIDGLFHIGRMSRKKQIGFECFEVRRHLCAANQCGTGDIQIVVLNGFEYAQAGIRAVSRHDDHFDHLLFAGFIQTEKSLDQLESRTFRQGVVFMLFLIGRIGFQTMFFKDAVFCFQIKQGTGGDADYVCDQAW